MTVTCNTTCVFVVRATTYYYACYRVFNSRIDEIRDLQPRDLFYVAYDDVCNAQALLSLAAGASSAASVRNVSEILKFGRTGLRVYAALNQSTSSAQHRRPSTWNVNVAMRASFTLSCWKRDARRATVSRRIRSVHDLNCKSKSHPMRSHSKPMRLVRAA